MKVPADGRQRRGHDGLIEDGQQHAGHQRHQHQLDLAVGIAGRGGRSLGGSGHGRGSSRAAGRRRSRRWGAGDASPPASVSKAEARRASNDTPAAEVAPSQVGALEGAPRRAHREGRVQVGDGMATRALGDSGHEGVFHLLRVGGHGRSQVGFAADQTHPPQRPISVEDPLGDLGLHDPPQGGKRPPPRGGRSVPAGALRGDPDRDRGWRLLWTGNS